jgi:hypothetical protein
LPDTAVPDTQEFFENQSQTNALNAKRTFDEYQDLALTSARRSQAEFDKLNNVALQALQNAVETANMIGKQAVKHADVAADALWTDELNPMQRGAAGAIAAVPGVAAGGVAATIPASSDARIISLIENLTAQVALLAQLVQNAKQTATT